LLLLFVVLLAASIRVCCCGCTPSRNLLAALAFLTLITFLLLAASVIVYGVFSYIERRISLTGTKSRFDWAYFGAIAAAGASLLAAVQFVSGWQKKSSKILTDYCRPSINVAQSETDNDRLL
jgi:hypothetical protein